MKLSALIVMLYSLMLLLGGMIGFLKAQSLVSLIMGASFALATFASAFLMLKGNIAGWWSSLILTLFLTGFFGVRFYLSHKMMPGGVMLVLSLVVLFLLLFLSKEKISIYNGL